jgi:hypothetical protein
MGAACSKRLESSLRPSVARVLVVSLTQEQSLRAQVGWTRLLKCLHTVRKLQRYHAYTGHRLQQIGEKLRKQLVLIYVKEK